ncbi:MAG: hypothetical protein KAS29_00105, partial [Bacteroidales bacterium]|nr:hypothetical protein [Bacteroidales bacterium]
MKYRSIVVLLIFLSYGHFTMAQVKDSIRSKKIIHRSILPTAFIGAGILVNNSQFEQDLQENLRNSVGDDFNSDMDD